MISSNTEYQILNWKDECWKWHGKTLTGKYKHYCPDWDYLPIDDTCEMEINYCTCDKFKLEKNDVELPNLD